MTTKEDPLKAVKKITSDAAGFNQDNRAKGLCVQCGLLAGPRCSTDAGRREYQVSGICEVCFDEAFSEEEGDYGDEEEDDSEGT